MSLFTSLLVAGPALAIGESVGNATASAAPKIGEGFKTSIKAVSNTAQAIAFLLFLYFTLKIVERIKS